jgi:hypothetical protein
MPRAAFFCLRRDQRGAAVELINDLEDDLLALVSWRVRHEQSADLQVRVGAQWFRDQRVRSFLDTVMHEPEGAVQPLDELQANRLPQVRADLVLRRSAHECERGQVGAVAEAGELLQCPASSPAGGSASPPSRAAGAKRSQNP